jgi:hypothetical protein
MQWLARFFARAQAPEGSPEAQPPVTDASTPNVEELSMLLREARVHARAARQRGRVLQREGRMGDALKAFKTAGKHQDEADRLERQRSLIRRAG